MNFPHFSAKQRVARAVWIVAGLAAVFFALRFRPTIAQANGGRPYEVWESLYFLGVACVASGIAAFFTSRRPLILLGLATLAMIVGGFVGDWVSWTIYPDAHMKGISEELTAQRRQVVAMVNVGFALGAGFVPLIAALSASRRKCSEPATLPYDG